MEVPNLLKVVLVDDEILALNILEAILMEIGNVEIVGKFLNPVKVLEQVEELKPDVAFLDIEMPQMLGLKVAEKMNSMQIDIVFVTAYNHYALEAFNVQAIDYILKPIEKNRLKRTVERILQQGHIGNSPVMEGNVLSSSFLGGFKLLDKNNDPIKWRTKKVKELCAYLIFKNEPVHKDKMMEDLWTDQSQDKAISLLHTTMYQLRKVLKTHGFDEPVKYVDERYSLTINVKNDATELKQIISQAPGSKDDRERVLSLYKSDYLAEEDYYWSINEREQLRRMVTQYLEKEVANLSNENNIDSLLKVMIEKLISIDPWEDQYTFELIQYYIHRGSYREAVTAYDLYKDTLWLQLGTKPHKKIDELIKTIK